jgi:hypothetical protein
MSGQNPVAREAEIVRLLNAIHGSSLNYSLIGGYAVDAYSPLPRYSVDCDIVTETKELGDFTDLLMTNGFTTIETVYENEIEGIQTKSYVKRIPEGPVTAELMIDGVRCRQTEAVWKAHEVMNTTAEGRIVCVNDTLPSRVVSREMLIAMKLHSGRDTDHRDIVMLADGADWNSVKDFCDRGAKPKLKAQLEVALATLGAQGFGAALKAAFASKQDQGTRIAGAAGNISNLLRELS